jgi:hypothetical protein
MNPSARPEVIRENRQGKEDRGIHSLDPVPQQVRPDEHPPPPNPVGPHVPDLGAFEAFVGGAGI